MLVLLDYGGRRLSTSFFVEIPGCRSGGLADPFSVLWSGMWVGGWSGVVVGRVEGHPWSSGGALEHRGAPSEISKETLIKLKKW